MWGVSILVVVTRRKGEMLRGGGRIGAGIGWKR